MIPKMRGKVSEKKFPTESISGKLLQYAEIGIDGGKECGR